MGLGHFGTSVPGRIEGVKDKDANQNLKDKSTDEKETDTGMGGRGDRGDLPIIVVGILANSDQDADKSRKNGEEAKDLDRSMESKDFLSVREEPDDEGSGRKKDQERNGHQQT